MTTQTTSGGAADLIIHGGRVLCMGPGFPTAEAVAIRDGEIIGVGSEADIKKLMSSRTETIDAAGGTILPGINDSHLHFSTWPLAAEPHTWNVFTTSIEDLVGRVRQLVESTPGEDAWIRGVGWDAHHTLPRDPTRHDLDAVSGRHPIVLRDFTVHTAVVNTRVLELAGITRDTVAPVGGIIERDEHGEPTGVFRESALELIDKVIPPFTREQIREGMASATTLLHALGTTSVTDPGIDLDAVELFAEMVRNGELGVRVNGLLRPERDMLAAASPANVAAILDGYRRPEDVDPRMFRVLGLKFWADGNPPAQTSWLHEPYVDGSNGSLTVEGANVAEKLASIFEIIRLADAAGMQVGTHATGDATIDAVVAAYLPMIRARGANALRHYVIHADLATRSTLQTMGRHQILANMNPSIKWLLGRSMDGVLGPQRTDYQFPMRSALDAGVPLACASDAPVFEPDWRLGVRSSVLRQDRDGHVAGAEECISLQDALAAYTTTPAWQDHAEDWKGRLTVGYVADVCIVADDILEADPHELTHAEVSATVLAGKVVYEKDRATAERARQLVGTTGHDHAHDADRTTGCCCERAEEIRGGLG